MMTREILVLYERNSSKDDELLAACVRIERRLFPKHESLASTMSVEARKKSQRTVVMTIDKDTVAGYMIITNSGNVLKLAVNPLNQRTGVARSLLLWAKKQHLSLMLHVDPERIAAVSLYRDQGFEEVTTVSDFYQRGRNAILMQWRHPTTNEK
uniref:N-acetyltransferase domain-containing protein n=1 Tax=Spongospora subterranea TaxID=70186 RepID=A0A0H5RAS8_9EUKA|eukprot:CRZ11275.1 hypothetical protein [Spongospora subterranea]